MLCYVMLTCILLTILKSTKQGSKEFMLAYSHILGHAICK